MANLYNSGMASLCNGTIDWDTTSGIKVALVTSSYTFDADHNAFDDLTNEITNANYTAGGNAISGRTVTQDDANDRAVCDGTDVTFTALAAGDLPGHAIVYRDSGNPSTSELIAYLPLTAPPAPDGNDYVIAWDADGLFYLESP